MLIFQKMYSQLEKKYVNNIIHYIHRYKLIYILLALGITTFTLASFSKIVEGYFSIKYNWLFELGMVIGQILFQWIFLFKYSFSKKWTYAYHLLTVSFIGSLLLLSLLLIHQLYSISSIAALCYFFAVVIFMFINHRYRVIKLGLPKFICYTWVLYRLLIFLFIIKYP